MHLNSLKRNISIDLIKTVAIAFVVIIHSCTFSFPVASQSWMISLFYRSLTGGAVPLFLMASGAVMLNPEKEITLKKLYFKNILRIVLAMFFWGFAYKIWHLYELSAINLENIISSLKELFYFNHEFHFYYMHMILIVYVFLPITKTIVKNSDKTKLWYLIVIWTSFAIVYPTVWRYYPFNNFMGMTTMYGINLTYASIGYGIWGYYLLKYPFSKTLSLILFALGFALTFGLTYFKSAQTNVLYEHFLAGNGVPVCLMASGLYSFFQRINIKNTLCVNAVIFISKSSFCIYLVHMLVMHILKYNGLDTSLAPDIVSIPAYAFVILLISIVIYFILSKIPFVKKWFI